MPFTKYLEDLQRQLEEHKPYEMQEFIPEEEEKPSLENIYSPENIKNLYEKSGSIVSSLADQYSQAKEPKEEDIKKARFAAGLTDTFSSLADMFTHGQGGLVKERQPSSSLSTTNARIREMMEKYEKQKAQDDAMSMAAKDRMFQLLLKGDVDGYNKMLQDLTRKEEKHYAQEKEKEGRSYKEKEGLKQRIVEAQRAQAQEKALQKRLATQSALRKSEYNARYPNGQGRDGGARNKVLSNKSGKTVVASAAEWTSVAPSVYKFLTDGNYIPKIKKTVRNPIGIGYEEQVVIDPSIQQIRTHLNKHSMDLDDNVIQAVQNLINGYEFNVRERLDYGGSSGSVSDTFEFE